MNAADHYLTRYLEAKDLDQYNALLRYTFQVTEEELTATGWKDDEIKQSKFPVLERADVLGCFDGDTLVSQFAVYPLKMNIYDTVYHVGFVTSVCTYPEYTGQGIMKHLMIKGLTQMHEEGKSFALLYPYSIPLYHHLGWEIVSNKISFNIKDRQIPTKVKAPGYVRRVSWDNTEFHELHSHFASITHAVCSATVWPGRNTGAGTRMIPMLRSTTTSRISPAATWSTSSKTTSCTSRRWSTSTARPRKACGSISMPMIP